MGKSGHSLTIIGDVGVDLVLGPVSGWPQMGTETLVNRNDLRPGGSGANAALAASWLGSTAHLIAAVGNDDLGRWLRDKLIPMGATLEEMDCATTLSVGILHDGGERSFFTTRGHLERISAAHVRPHLVEAPHAKAMVLLSGVFLTPLLRAQYDALIDELRGLGYQVALDTNWPPGNWDEAVRREVAGWMSRCDHVLLNDLEIAGLAGTQDMPAALRRLQGYLREGATLVVKRGAGGAIAVQDGCQFEASAEALPIFDTIGAGDSFNAAYLLERSRGAALQEALNAACRSASHIIARFPRRGLDAGAPAATWLQSASTGMVTS